MSLSKDEDEEILRIFFTIEHFLNLDIMKSSFVMYAKEFQEAYHELKSQAVILKGIYKCLVALKQNEIEYTESLQQLFIKKLLQIGKYAFQGAFNFARAKNWAIKTPVHG